MRRLLLVLAAIVVMPASTAVAKASGATSASGTAASYIVVFKNTVADPGAVATVQGRAHGFQAQFVYSHALKGYAASLSPAVASALAADPAVSYVVPDAPVHVAGQFVPNWVRRIGADMSTAQSGDGTGSVNINVAVIDTGIDLTHPDLNVAGGKNCANGQSFADADGHGSIVAGIIGAKDNAFGVVGTAPGANLWSVRVLNNKGVGSASSELCGIDWVTGTRTDTDPANDIAVANMSIGGKGPDDGNCGNTPKRNALHQAICASVAVGVTYAVSAGNDSADFQTEVPAAYDEVLTVTAIADLDGQPGTLAPPQTCSPTQTDDSFATFSNFATLPADQAHAVAATGVCVTSTYKDGLYAFSDGTSFASPAVAGSVALCIANGPCAGLTPAQIIQKFVNDAAAYNTANPGYGFQGDPIRQVTGKYYGYLIHAGSY